MNLKSKFSYCITTKLKILHFVFKRDGIKDKWTIRFLDAPGGPLTGKKTEMEQIDSQQCDP